MAELLAKPEPAPVVELLAKPEPELVRETLSKPVLRPELLTKSDPVTLARVYVNESEESSCFLFCPLPDCPPLAMFFYFYELRKILIKNMIFKYEKKYLKKSFSR